MTLFALCLLLFANWRRWIGDKTFVVLCFAFVAVGSATGHL